MISFYSTHHYLPDCIVLTGLFLVHAITSGAGLLPKILQLTEYFTSSFQFNHVFGIFHFFHRKAHCNDDWVKVTEPRRNCQCLYFHPTLCCRFSLPSTSLGFFKHCRLLEWKIPALIEQKDDARKQRLSRRYPCGLPVQYGHHTVENSCVLHPNWSETTILP